MKPLRWRRAGGGVFLLGGRGEARESPTRHGTRRVNRRVNLGRYSRRMEQSDRATPRTTSGWAVLNSPIVIALLTSGLLAALGATYNNRQVELREQSAKQAEMAAVATEFRLRVARLEAIEVALTKTGEPEARQQLGSLARAIISGTESQSIQREYRGVHMRSLARQLRLASPPLDPEAEGDLLILDASDRIAAQELSKRLTRLRDFARLSELHWAIDINH